jgi:hypothetical protein
MADSLLQYFRVLDPNGTFRMVLLWAAAVLSIIYAIRGLGRRGKKAHPRSDSIGDIISDSGSGSGSIGTASGDVGAGSEGSPSASAPGWAIPVLAAAALLFIVVLLSRLEIVPLFTAELSRSFALACFYLYAGMKLGREIVYLGLWLLSLSIIITVWYLGYAPIILGFSAGASLLACAVILRIWRRASLRI